MIRQISLGAGFPRGVTEAGVNVPSVTKEQQKGSRAEAV